MRAAEHLAAGLPAPQGFDARSRKSQAIAERKQVRNI